MQYYAHTLPDLPPEKWQPLDEHLAAVAQLSSNFAAQFDCADLGYLLGILHDVGKYSRQFQARLSGSQEHVDHKTAGGSVACQTYGADFYGLILAYAIVGHHGGLPDYGSTLGRGLKAALTQDNLPDYSAYRQKITLDSALLTGRKLNLQVNAELGYFSLSFLIRQLYSGLVDADFLDTEQFCAPELAALRQPNHASVQTACARFLNFTAARNSQNEHKQLSEINLRRAQIYEQSVAAGSLPQGFFSFTAPTGSGKTLSSFAFAARQVQQHDLQKIIYVLPYTSIIEQNAEVLRSIIGSENLLEHHSNFDAAQLNDEAEGAEQKLKLAAENWDLPVIMTSNVQFFQSLFAARSSACRKLHNLVGSVIILDEAQMLPCEYLRPCLAALVELVQNYHCTVVFCTATQPALTAYLPPHIRVREILADPAAMYTAFRRVHVRNLGLIGDEALAATLQQAKQALVIVNTRRHAEELYRRLQSERTTDEIFHLSGKMCPKHRQAVLTAIKAKLHDNQPCLVVSTQLIEAGVDIDFPLVYRAMSGLDSLAQAAGRCNREGKQPRGEVVVFESAEDYGKACGWQSKTAALGKELLAEYPEDCLCLPAIEQYFRRLYTLSDLDKQQILPLLGARQPYDLHFAFAEAAEKFQIIEQGTVSLIIPYDARCRELLEQARWSKYPQSLARKLQLYTINLYPREFGELQKAGRLACIGEVLWVLTDWETCYSEECGLISGSIRLDDYIQ